MGWNYSFISFRAAPPVVFERLQLKPTGQKSEVLADLPFAGIALDTGWFMVLAQRDFRFVDAALLEDLSHDCELLGGAVSETSMVSQVHFWSRGVLEWGVTHDGSVGGKHLEMVGAPPREAHTLLADARANKKPFIDHVFEVPIDLAGLLMGFAFSGAQTFEELVVEPAAWREFRHADGRAWAIRVGGKGYQLRIGAVDDDPVLRERPTTRPLRDIEGLIAEQRADGFQAAP